MTLAEFDRLYAEFEVVHQARRSQMTTRRKDGQAGQRAVGGGPTRGGRRAAGQSIATTCEIGC